jgi:GntR family transcriptional regulator
MEDSNLAAVPLYVQIAESVSRRIRAGELHVGERLPSERQLSEDLGVSRMTVRQALLALRDQGLIDGQPGRGNFVSAPKVEQPVDVLIGFSANVTAKGMRPGARLLALESVMADRTIGEALQIPLGEPVYSLRRLRLANESPAALEHSFFPVRSCPGLDAHDLETRSVYAILAEEYGIRLVSARQSLEPTVARLHEAKLLGIPAGAPLMLVERTSYDEHQRAVEFAKDLYRGDWFRFVSHSRQAMT